MQLICGTVHWKDKWDEYSKLEREEIEYFPLERLLDNVSQGRYGRYYNIWYVIAERSSLEEAGWVLFHVLKKDIDYLYRYHSAAALIELLGSDEFEPVDLSADHEKTRDNIDRMNMILIERIGNYR
ncbi:MAG: hypothetical protein KAW14_06415 [Candidatus Aegiribacteria sp.]|nr:hypothetical protein [Candidatus Aegiribacteria sp.]